GNRVPLQPAQDTPRPLGRSVPQAGCAPDRPQPAARVSRGRLALHPRSVRWSHLRNSEDARSAARHTRHAHRRLGHPPDDLVIERAIAATTHGRYLVVLPPHGGPAPMMVGFHGYAEGAEAQLERMRTIPGADRWLLVAIQGLH